MPRRARSVALVALVAAIGTALAWTLVPAERFVFGAAAAGPDAALLLTRRNEEYSTAFWVEHVDVEGRVRWSAEVSPLEPHEALGFTGVAVAEDRVIVLARQGEREVAVALERASGRRLWEAPLPAVRQAGGRIGPTVLVDGPRVYLVRETSAATGLVERIDAVALADGAALWTFEADRNGDVHLLAPGRLLVSGFGEDGSVIDGASGAVSQTVALTRVACPLADGVLALHLGRAVVVPGAADAPVWRAGPDPDWRVDGGPCGLRGEDPVLGAHDAEFTAAGLVRVDRRTGSPRWQLALGARQLEPMVTLDGRLPRWLPVSAYGDDAGASVRELMIVDLDAGTIARRSSTADYAEVIVTAERAFVWLRFRQILIGLDPETGALAGATSFAGISSEIRRDDFASGALWLHGMGWARPAGLPWAAVDLSTGGLIRANGAVTASDASAQLRAALGW